MALESSGITLFYGPLLYVMTQVSTFLTKLRLDILAFAFAHTERTNTQRQLDTLINNISSINSEKSALYKVHAITLDMQINTFCTTAVSDST